MLDNRTSQDAVQWIYCLLTSGQWGHWRAGDRVGSSTATVHLLRNMCLIFCSLKVKACFEYTAKPSSYNPPITILGVLEAEKERRKSGLSSRVQFRNQGSEPKYTQELTLNRQKQRACMEETLWLQVSVWQPQLHVEQDSVFWGKLVSEQHHSSLCCHHFGGLFAFEHLCHCTLCRRTSETSYAQSPSQLPWRSRSPALAGG